MLSLLLVSIIQLLLNIKLLLINSISLSRYHANKEIKQEKWVNTNTGLLFDNMNILSHQNDIDEGGISLYTQKSSYSVVQKDLIQLAQMVVPTNQNNNDFDGPSLANKEVLNNALIHILMFTS